MALTFFNMCCMQTAIVNRSKGIIFVTFEFIKKLKKKYEKLNRII